MRLCLFILFFAQIVVKAQSGDPVVIFQSSRKEISITNEELTDITVKVVNTTGSVLNASINVETDKEINLVSRNNTAISLKPGDSTYIPIKVFITQKAQAGRIHMVRFFLNDAENKVLARDSCSLQVAIKRNMTLFAMVSNILLEKNIDSLRIPVRITNMGNSAQKVTIITSYPSSVESSNFHPSLQLTIPALKDTLITFVKPINGRMFAQEAFDVNIVGLYANAELFSAVYVRVQSARSNRSYIDQSLNETYDNNSISISSQGLFRPSEVYLLQGRGLIDLPDGRFSYNLDVSTYKNSSYSPTMVRNTYVGYETHNMGLQAGNINKNLDINLSGRGCVFFLNDTARKNRYEGGYINSNSNLFSKAYSNLFPTGEAAWASFVHKKKNWNLSSSALYELNPMLKAKNMILANEISWKNAKDFRFAFSLNSGRTTEYDNLGNGTYGSLGNSKFSFASGLEISGNVKKLMFNSSNYISSGYYPGTRRGALNFSERVTLTRSSGHIWVSTDYYRYTPKYFSNAFFFEPSFSNLRADIGWSQKIFNKITLSVSPYYMIERNNSFQFLGESSLFLRSWNILTTVNVPISATQYISINAEGGAFNSSVKSKSQFHFRSNSNYRYGPFNLMASAQVGTYYLGEIVNTSTKPQGNNYTINITPTVQKIFFRSKLRTEIGVNYNIAKLSGKSWQLTGRTEYDILPKTSVFTSVNHNQYTFLNGRYTSSILEVGIRKKMRSTKLGAVKNPLEIFVFKDMNQNGIYDAVDSVATNHLVYINDVAFMTKQDGTVLYKNVPPGEYRISLPKLKGWYAPDQKINFDKKERVEIPLQKTGTLRGQITYHYNEFSYEVGQQMEGLVVTAIGENGHTYTTRTNNAGRYVFFIPIGKYKIGINQENLPVEVECEKNNLQTDVISGVVMSVDLVLNVKQRKIETKRFVSPSLRK